MGLSTNGKPITPWEGSWADKMDKEKRLKAAFPKLKAALTKAKNSGDHRKVIVEVVKAFAFFDEVGYPDNWSLWQRAKDDAEFKLRMG